MSGAGQTVGWALLCAGGFIVWEAYRGVNPLTDLQAIVSGQPRPTPAIAPFTSDTPGASDAAVGDGGSVATTPYGGGNTTTATNTRQAICDFALAQAGKQYRWGGLGPDVWDCAGLTWGAYKAAGLILPHGSNQQALVSDDVGGQANALPGDLVFYGRVPACDHVAVYMGGGKMVAADHPDAFGPGHGIGEEDVYPFNSSPGHPAAWYGRPKVLAKADGKATTTSPRQIPHRTH